MEFYIEMLNLLNDDTLNNCAYFCTYFDPTGLMNIFDEYSSVLSKPFTEQMLNQFEERVSSYMNEVVTSADKIKTKNAIQSKDANELFWYHPNNRSKIITNVAAIVRNKTPMIGVVAHVMGI